MQREVRTKVHYTLRENFNILNSNAVHYGPYFLTDILVDYLLSSLFNYARLSWNGRLFVSGPRVIKLGS